MRISDWSSDVCSSDLRAEALTAEGNAIEAEYEDVEELPEEVAARLEAIDEELAGLIERPRTYDPREMDIAGAFVSLDTDGSLFVERGWVRAEDEPQVAPEPGDDEAEGEPSADPVGRQQPADRIVGRNALGRAHARTTE